MKMHLASTDYGNFLQNEPSPISTTTLAEKCTEKLVEEFNFLRVQAVEPLATFCEYITYGYMIDNVLLILAGILHGRDAQARPNSSIHNEQCPLCWNCCLC